MKTLSPLRILGWFTIIALAACGGEEKPPKNSGDWMDNLKQVKSGDGGGSDVEDEEIEEPEPESTAAADPAPPMPTTTAQPSSGRPAILMGPTKEISSTFGNSPGAVLKLSAEGGTIVFKIPEGSLNTGYNITWKIFTGKGASFKNAIGSVAYMMVQQGKKLSAKRVTTVGSEFEIRWPLMGKDTINLAVGEVDTDEGGNESGSPKFRVIAPKNVDTGFGEAYFYVNAIGPVMYLHATSSAPTE